MKEEKTPQYVVDETLEDSLRYTETIGDNERGGYRECALWVSEHDKPVSSMRFYPFEQRFGSVAVPVEGIGDVNTLPDHRKKGYVSKLMRRALAGMADRVDASFLFGISRLYQNFGFTSCLGGSWFTLWLKYAEALRCPDNIKPEPFSKEDLPAINELFNQAHHLRPWTRVRTETVALRLFGNQAWQPSPETVVWKEGSVIRAYVVINGYGYGWGREKVKVAEAIADSHESASAILALLREKGIERGVDSAIINEPPDSVVGRSVRLLGGEYRQKYNADGGGMGLILNRPSLVDAMKEEFARRMGDSSAVADVCAALGSGEIIPDSSSLMRLLIGFWSWEDAQHAGVSEPTRFAELMPSLFPGSGNQILPAAYAHGLDGY
jgi:predicted GNAT family N-acyltransferase